MSSNVSWVELPSLVSILCYVFDTWHEGHGNEGARIPTNRFIEELRGIPDVFQEGSNLRARVEEMGERVYVVVWLSVRGRDESERPKAESQWIVAARPICHLQYTVTYLSHLQRFYPSFSWNDTSRQLAWLIHCMGVTKDTSL